MTELNLRPAVRALMIDSGERVLMVKLDYWNRWIGWVLPGGGIEAGEDAITALRRELAEETGAVDVFVGPPVCRRRHVSQGMIEGYDGQEETIYLVPCAPFEVDPQLSVEQLRAEGVTEVRWWSVDELVMTDEIVKPENLVDLIKQILDNGAPDEPLVLEQID